MSSAPRPSTCRRRARDCEAAHAEAAQHFARCRQHTAVVEHLRLNDPDPGLGVVRPEDGAVEANAGDAAAVHQQDLRNARERREVWRAVAAAACLLRPAWRAGREIVGDKTARRRSHQNIADDERRRGKCLVGLRAPVSFCALRVQMRAPVVASSAFTMPVAPIA